MSTLVQEAKQRIKKVRQAEVKIVVHNNNQPVQDAVVNIRMLNHHYLFGAVCYQYGKYSDPAMNDRFTDLFVKLFNYTMVPYHWSWYEPQKGKFNEPYTSNLIKWADKNHLKKKLHALIWQDLIPDWINYNDDIKQLYTERISRLMQLHGDDFDFFDVANETTVHERYIGTPNDTPVAHWIRDYGPINMVKFGTKLVRSFKPEAKLIYGDFNIHVDKYFDFLREMRDNDVDIDILGMQSHMHRERWTYEHTIETIDRAAAFGWPIHFPECSILSGSPVGDINYHTNSENKWRETEEDLLSQAAYAEDFYTLVFGHPATEALSWFDLTDHRWLGAPSGVVTEDLKEKPIYKTLDRLINHEWRTDANMTTSSDGVCGARLFFGDYETTVTSKDKKTTHHISIPRKSFYAGVNDEVVIKLEV